MHPTQICQWKRQLGTEAKEILGSRRAKGAQDQETLQTSLYEEIERLKMDLDWVQQLQASAEEKRQWIDPAEAFWKQGRRDRLVDDDHLPLRSERLHATKLVAGL